MQKTAKEDKRKKEIIEEPSDWLSEFAGIAILTIDNKNNVTLNSHAQKLLSFSFDCTSLKNLISFTNSTELNKLIELAKKHTQEQDIRLSAAPGEIQVKVFAKQFKESGKRCAILIPMHNTLNNKVDSLLKELEKHESQVEIAIEHNQNEIQKLHKELAGYKKELSQQLNIWKASFDNSNDAVLWLNKTADIIYSNQSAQKLLKYPHNALLEKKLFEISENFNKKEWAGFWKKVTESKITRFYSEFIDADENTIRAEININHFVYENENLAYLTIFDLTAGQEGTDKLLYLRKFENLVVNISTRFINIGTKQIKKNIDLALKEICFFTQTEASYIYTIDRENKILVQDHFYKSRNLSFNPKKLKTYPYKDSDEFISKLKNKGLNHVSFLYELGPDSRLRKECKNAGINSFIHIGLVYQYELIGLMGFASMSPNRNWSEDELRLLQVLGDIFVSAEQRTKALSTLQDSETTLREIYNASNEAIFIHDIETGQTLDVNHTMLKMFEVNYNEALNFPIKNYILPNEEDENEWVQQIFKDALEEPQEFEWQLVKKNGQPFWVEISLRKAKIHGKDRLISMVRDISDRKRSESLLKESEEKYRMIVEGQNDLIIKINPDGIFLFVSPSYCKLFNKTEQELMGSNFFPLVHKDDLLPTQLAMEKLHKPPYSCYLEQRANTGDGWRWLAWNVTSIVNDNNEVTEMIGVGRDITYQKMVENALRESEERFRSIVQNLSDIVFLLDENANVKYVTPSSQNYLGIPVQDLLGMSITNLVHPEDIGVVSDRINLHLKGKEFIQPYEVRIRHAVKGFRSFEAKSHNMLSHPSVNSIIFTVSDITDRKMMEKQVLDAIIKTEEKERERFAKDLHDDLGPLLSSIKMYIGMLGKAKNQDKQKFIVENLYEIVKEAIATTKEVSNDLNPHVLNNYGLISALELFIEKISADINFEFVKELINTRYAPAIEVSLYRISKELINNSIKHSKANYIKLCLIEKNTSLHLYYEDNGTGIDERTLQSLRTRGMGISNIISRSKSLNAKYAFHTDLNKGFKFELKVPLIQE